VYVDPKAEKTTRSVSSTSSTVGSAVAASTRSSPAGTFARKPRTSRPERPGSSRPPHFAPITWRGPGPRSPTSSTVSASPRRGTEAAVVGMGRVGSCCRSWWSQALGGCAKREVPACAAAPPTGGQVTRAASRAATSAEATSAEEAAAAATAAAVATSMFSQDAPRRSRLRDRRAQRDAPRAVGRVRTGEAASLRGFVRPPARRSACRGRRRPRSPRRRSG
jgi:hypothetical protein